MVLSISRKGLSLIDKNTSKLVFNGKIRDSLHDTISFTELEKNIINSKEFQRLRRISQTAFTQYVFPGASHTRFEHSLGVMHIAGLMFNAIALNQRRLLSSLSHAAANAPQLILDNLKSNENERGSLLDTENALNWIENSAYICQCVRLAALLHDIGHAPYSHSGERFMISWHEFSRNLDNIKLPNWLKNSFTKKINSFKEKNINLLETKIKHEVYTLMIISKLFNSELGQLTKQMGQDICAILDLNVEPEKNSELAKSGLQSLLHEIVSGEIDADRMDYLLRDSRECGIIYGYFDLGRILDSLGFYYNSKNKKYHLALRRSGISAFEDYLRARWSMYQQVYFHKTVTATEAMFQNINKNNPEILLPIEVNEFILIDDHNFFSYIKNKFNNLLDSFSEKILVDLIYNRNLWKRVYEECIPKNSSRDIPSLCPAIVNFLESLNYPCELIENSTNLTNFSPKGRNSVSKNHLKIIIKDVYSLKYLEPIENHSVLINSTNEEIIIRRIYISQFNINKEPIITKEIQKLISDNIIHPDKG